MLSGGEITRCHFEAKGREILRTISRHRTPQDYI